MGIIDLNNKIKDNPKNGDLYIQLGDEYSKTNINQAYLCYEQASNLCVGDKYTGALNKMNSCKVSEDFYVHPVSFVILSYNSKDIMIECLEAIRNTCTKGSYEVIVVDSNSTDGIREWLQEQNDIKLILNDKFDGFAAGCNQGAKMAETDNDIYLLNNDAIVTPRSLFYMRLALYSKEKIGAVGPVSSNVVSTQLYDFSSRSHDEWMKLAESINHPSSNPIQYAHWLQGHALLIKRRVWDEAGMLDTDFKFGGDEDLEYGIRLNLLGYQLCVCRNAFVYHYGSKSMNVVKDIYKKSLEINHKIFEYKYNLPMHMVQNYNFNNALQFVKNDSSQELKVLQIYGGCSNFLNIFKYKYKNVECTSIESNNMASKISANYSNSFNLNLDCDNLLFENESFDYIFFCDIERCNNLADVLKKLKCILKPLGHLIIESKNASHISIIDSVVNGTFDSPLIKKCKHCYTTEDIRLLVDSCGYRIFGMVWNYSSDFASLTRSQNELLNKILNLPNAKDKNTYVHTSVFIDMIQ